MLEYQGGYLLPRTFRKTGSTGYTHVIARGISKQILFESSSDYRKYLLLLQKCCLETGVKISEAIAAALETGKGLIAY